MVNILIPLNLFGKMIYDVEGPETYIPLTLFGQTIDDVEGQET